MQIIEQKKLLDELKIHKGKMASAEQFDLEMFQKRQKDDEELDKLSYQKLKDMHKKYVIRPSGDDVAKLLFKKSE